jgi:hypothetical protein
MPQTLHINELIEIFAGPERNTFYVHGLVGGSTVKILTMAPD